MYCLVIYIVSSIDQIDHIYKFHQSMTFGELLDNNAQFFIFIS